MSASVGQPRLLSALSGLFGALAGLLAMVGVYGVTSYNVRRQRREFGIRLALGADPGAVQRLIVRRGARSPASASPSARRRPALTRVLGSMLNDVKPTDPRSSSATPRWSWSCDGGVLHPGALGRTCRSCAGAEKRLTPHGMRAAFTVSLSQGIRRSGDQEE